MSLPPGELQSFQSLVKQKKPSARRRPASYIDNWFLEPDEIRASIEKNAYEGIKNPVDGLFYPNVSLDIPDAMREEHLAALKEMAGDYKEALLFLRMSLQGVTPPHQVHTDTSMADLTCITYLTLPEYCQGGTSLLKHDETEGMGDPLTEEEHEIWERDKNDRMKWNIFHTFPMEYNATVIFDSRHFHRSEPVGGFGSSFADGRLVLVSFLRMHH